jgi:hypothetical protein
MMTPAEPQEGHRWLQRLLGDWTSEEGEEPKKCRGTESVRPLGELWVLAEGQGDMPGGGEAQMLMTLGYDPAKGKFVGTWVGSVMTNLWVYEGTLDESGNKLTLETEGPDFGGSGKMAQYRDTIEFLSDDHRTLTGSTKGEDGQWKQFMVTHYYRKR